jgi:LPXTG-motif cell wall-anchored protein
MKLSARLSAAAAIVGASVLIVAAPAVAAPWVGTYVIGGTNWQLRDNASGIGHTYDEANFLSSVSHRFGALYVDGSAAWCDTATADLEIDAGTGDVIVTCDAQEITPGIFVTTENLSAGDTWVIVTDPTSQTTVAGSVWAQTGNTATTSSGDISSEETFHDFVSTTFAAGSTTYVADFVTIHLPADPYDDPAIQAAFTAAADASVEFDTFSGRLIAGLPEGITVLNWGSTTPAAPALADTGFDATGTMAFAAGALLLLAGGAGLVISRRRRATA